MPTLQEEYDVLAGELRGLNVRLDLPEDDGISQAQPIGAQFDALAGELRGLNARLGLPEDDGIPLTSFGNSEYENLVRQNNALDQRLSALFPTFDEWNAEQDELDKRSKWEATKTFTSNFFTGAGAMWDEGVKALDELTSGKAGADSLGGIWEVGRRDFGRFAKTMGGAAVDWLPTTESERSREYRRAKENFDYYQTVRPLMVDAVGGDAKNLVSFGAQFVDPFIFLPVAGWTAKAGAWGLKSARLGRAAAALDKVGDIVSIPSKAVAAATRKGIKAGAYVAGKGAGLVGTVGGGVAKLAALPRTLASKVAQKVLPESAAGAAGGALFTGQLVGAATGVVPFAAHLGIGEIAGFIANRTGKGIEKILTTLAAPGAQQRFLQRLAQTAESPRMRKLALWAHRKGGTKLGDVAFNALVNGASIASINGALAYLSGESAEGIGQAAGAGMIMGGVLPFGQPGQRAGKSLRSRDATSINYLEGKLASEQIKEFRKLTPEARLVAATAEEAGIPIPKLFFVDSKMFLEIMRKDDPNAREAQSAMYDPKDKTIYVNQDVSSKLSSRAVLQIFTEELGHHFITEAIKTDPMFGHQILAEYQAKPGEKSHTFVFERDPDGNPLRTIEINEKGKKLADAYSSISDDVNVGIGNDANLLAQEIGAAQFSIMMDENPNLFPHLAQPIRHKLVNASQKILSLMGITDKFGNTLPLNIASKLKRSPAIRNLYRNYLKQREMHMAGKIDLAEKGQSIPLKRGESPEAGAERLFGATGLSLKDAKAFVINNRQIKNELTKLKNRYQDAPADGWSVVRGRLIGKKLTPDMRVILTRTNPDPRGSVNLIINDVQAAIANNSEVNFLFRSGKPSKYSDNELKVRVVAPVGLEFTGMAGKGAAGLYMQGMDIAYLKNNVEVLVQEGFIKDPDKFIAEARQVAKDAVSDPEGRINPEGKFENELITVALGNEASAAFIKNPRLARLLEEGRLQHSFRMYHIGSLAGIALTGRPGIGFDWYNVKRNYSPHGRNFMPRRRSPDDTIPLPFDELPGDKPGQGFARMVDVGKTKTELAEAAKMADEQKGWRAGNVRSKDAYGRDKLFMPADRALGLPDNIRDEVLPGIKQDKFSRGQLEAALLKSAGSKAYAEEIGLMDWLKDRKSVTKAEVDAFVAENAPRLEEKVLEMTDPGGGPNPPKFSDYQEPGGTNYREVLVKLPAEDLTAIDPRDAVKREKIKSSIYRDPHFNEDNVLLHLRLNDRIDANGKKVLFIEELQSDWHQKGRKDGYGQPVNQSELPVLLREAQSILEKRQALEAEGRIGESNALANEHNAINARIRSVKGEGVPDAPFKKNWPALGLKRAIREALENGYDRIAWLDGEGQAARYDLSKHISKIDYSEGIRSGEYQSELRAYDHDGGLAIKRTGITHEQLPNYIGKEAAEKILAKKPVEHPWGVGVSKYRNLSGLDLKVGGEGMKAFYDRELVSIANKISKKIGGGKVRKALIPRGRLVMTAATSPSRKTIPKVHVLDLPKNPQAVENLRLYMPAQKAPSDSRVPTILRDLPAKGRGAGKAFMPNTVREGDVVLLNEESLRLFMPANDKVRLEDYVDRKMFALASDRLGIGRMLTGPKGKKKELTVDAQGGRGFMQIFNGGGWAFKGKQTADNFLKRVKEVAGGDDSVVVGITILSDLNHLHSAYGQLAYTNALRAAIESGTITEGMANRQIREIVKRIKQAKTKKPLPAESRKVVEGIKNFADFEKAVKAKKINFNLMAKVREKAEGKTLPLTAAEAAKLELDVPSIARDIADPELVGADFGKVVALLEVPVNQTPKKTDFHYSYPYTVEGRKIGFLEEFADIGELTSDPKIRTKQGRITAQPLQTVMPEFDRLRGNRFMPAK